MTFVKQRRSFLTLAASTVNGKLLAMHPSVSCRTAINDSTPADANNTIKIGDGNEDIRANSVQDTERKAYRIQR
jgi:hypothetical protein